jgi:hypothetical protein
MGEDVIGGRCPSWQAMVSVKNFHRSARARPPPADTPDESPAVTTSQVTPSIQDFAVSLGSDLAGLAAWINPVVRGWMNYYGRFSRSQMYRLLQRINTYIVRWARNKYRRLGSFKKAKRWWTGLVDREPGLFAHWAWISTF